MSLHCEFGPQGDGTHGFLTGSGSITGSGAINVLCESGSPKG
jgi:hypothetical protein